MVILKDWEAAYLAGIIDGEGSITLTRMHKNEYRRPCISISSSDPELIQYLKSLIGGNISIKKNYKPSKHKDSYTLSVKNKEKVLYILEMISPLLRVDKKKNRALWILYYYDFVTPRNGKYTLEQMNRKLLFEEIFFKFE